jgi:uncharacterized repeat protein (TIGR03803 family)
VLHSFAGYPTDAANPYYGLTQDAAGNLYGGATVGGAYGSGAVFKLSASGTETILYSFTGGADGGFPVGDLIRDTAAEVAQHREDPRLEAPQPAGTWPGSRRWSISTGGC